MDGSDSLTIGSVLYVHDRKEALGCGLFYRLKPDFDSVPPYRGGIFLQACWDFE